MGARKMITVARWRRPPRPDPRAAGLAIGIVADARHLADREPRALAAALRARGARVVVTTPMAADADGLRACHLVVARGRSPELLDTVADLQARGTIVMNRPAAITAVADEGRIAGWLGRAGLPTAASVGASPLSSREGCLQVYVAGDAVHAVRADGGRGARRAAVPVALAPDARALALRCGACFDLDLYGVVLLETPSGAVVVEVSDYPEHAVPEVDEAAASLALARAADRRSPRGASPSAPNRGSGSPVRHRE